MRERDMWLDAASDAIRSHLNNLVFARFTGFEALHAALAPPAPRVLDDSRAESQHDRRDSLPSATVAVAARQDMQRSTSTLRDRLAVLRASHVVQAT